MTRIDAIAQTAVFDIVNRQLVLRQGLPLLIGGSLVALAVSHLPMPDIAAVIGAARATAPWQWLVAGVLSMVSFWAVGRYDAAVHGLLGTGIDARRTRRSGLAAIALSQTTGPGLIIGALVRWRCLPDLGLAKAMAVTATVAGRFLAGLSVLLAALTLVGGAVGAAFWLAVAVLSAFAAPVAA